MTPEERLSWLEDRRSGVGGSDVAGILGLSPWSSPWSVWADKLNLLPPEPESEVMAAGRWLEAAIGPWFTHETGLHVAGEQTFCIHPQSAHHRATVDGFVVHDEHSSVADALGLIEIKVTGPGRRWEYLPDYHLCQGQWQMHVTGLDQVWFAVLMGRRLDIHELKRDQADIDLITERVDAFWHDHVVAGEPPPVDGSDATTRALAAVYPEGRRGDEVTADAVIQLQHIFWRQANAQRKEAEAAEKAAANEIRAYLGDATELLIDEQLAASWRPQKSRRIDIDRLRAEEPEIARRFTVESTTRVLRNHARKEKT